MNKLLRRFRIFAEGFLLVNLLWFAAFAVLNRPIVPNPVAVYASLGDLISDSIFLHILASLKRMGLGIALSLLVGVPVGILMAYSRVAGRLLYPLVYFTYPIPKTALLPIAMLLWGMRDGSKVAILFLIIVFQVILAVRDATLAIDRSDYLMTASAGAPLWQVVRHITLPAILPPLLTNLRIALGTALSVLFFVEAYGTQYGMGYYIVDAWSRLDYVGMYSGILVISIAGFLLFALVDLLSALLCGWNAPEETDAARPAGLFRQK